MLKLSRKMLLAVEAVLDIAYHGRAEPVQAKEITARQGAPQRALEQAMQHLVHKGVLKGVRGPRGGYVLARERRRVTVGQVVRALAELEAGEEGEALSQSALGEHVVRPIHERLADAMMRELDGLTIEALCREAEAAGVARARPIEPDFTI